MLNRRHFIANVAMTAASGLFGMPTYASQSKKLIITEAIRMPLYISLHAAEYLELFKKHGLESELSTAGTIALPVPLLLSQRADVGVTSPAMAMNAVREGGAMKVIAKMVGGVPMWGVAKPGSGIKTVADLKGKTIATLKFPSSTMQVPTYALRAAGLDPEKDVKFLELPLGAQIAAVKDGRADIATAFEWDISLGERDFGLEKVVSFAQELGPLVFTAAMATEQTIAERPDEIQAFCNAIAEAQMMLHQDHTIFEQVATKYYSQTDVEIIKMAAKNLMSAGNSIPRDPTISAAEWDANVKMEIAGGSIKEGLHYEKMVDNSFALQAVAQLS